MKALILGTLAGQVDAIEALKSRGVETHACGHRQQGPGVEAAHAFHLVDITDIDAVTILCRRIQADFLYSVGSDIAMPTVVAVSERLGLPHFHGTELTDLLRGKQKLRKVLDKAGLNLVDYDSFLPGEDVTRWNQFPCIIKPVDSQGQRGISVIRSKQELVPAVDVAFKESISGPVIIEEFLEGPEVSAHVIVVDGEIKFFMPSDRFVWHGPLVGIPSGHAVPLRNETAAAYDDLKDLVERIVPVLNVEEGPLYVQAIITEKGPRVIEIASRLDGCHLWRLLAMATGVDLLDIILGRLMGEAWPELLPNYKVEPMRLDFALGSPDVVVTEEYAENLFSKSALYSELQVEIGTQPRDTNGIVSRIGYEIYRVGQE